MARRHARGMARDRRARPEGAPFEKRLVARTYEGLEIQPLYTARDWDHTGDPAGVPGAGARVRGNAPLGGTRHGWDVREERAEADPGELNADILDDLEHGATSIDIRLNEALPLGPGAPGASGALLLCMDDLARALEGVHLGMITLAFTPGAAFAEVAGLARAVFDARGIDAAEARLAFNADPLAELSRTGTLPAPVEVMLDRLGALASWTDANLPRSTAVRVGTAPYHDANATAAQDLAYAMSTGLAYLRAMERAGLAPDRAARQIVFRFSLSCERLPRDEPNSARRVGSVNNVLEAVRNARRKSCRCGSSPAPRSDRSRTETRGSTCSATRRRASRAPWRGGDDRERPVRRAAGPARRDGEAGRAEHADDPRRGGLAAPGRRPGGRVVLHRAAHRGARRGGVDGLPAVEARGGMARALQTGLVHEQVSEAYAARLKNIAKRRDAVTGVSEFPNPGEPPVRRPAPEPAELATAAAHRLAERRTSPDLADRLAEVRRETWTPRRVDLLGGAAEAGATTVELAGAINNGCEPHDHPPRPAPVRRALRVDPRRERRVRRRARCAPIGLPRRGWSAPSTRPG
jgi:methylmalonyl-CoA mutase